MTTPPQPSLSVFFQVNELIRRDHPDMSLLDIQVFLAVARKPGIPMKELVDSLDIRVTSAYAAVARLGKRHGFGRAGYHLVQAASDPQDKRWKIMSLTEKGSQLAQKINYVITTKAAELV